MFVLGCTPFSRRNFGSAFHTLVLCNDSCTFSQHLRKTTLCKFCVFQKKNKTHRLCHQRISISAMSAPANHSQLVEFASCTVPQTKTLNVCPHVLCQIYRRNARQHNTTNIVSNKSVNKRNIRVRLCQIEQNVRVLVCACPRMSFWYSYTPHLSGQTS